MELQQLLSNIDTKRKADAERFRTLDQDECQLCYAHGADKRSLTISCLYDVKEVLPEAIDLADVPVETLSKRGYYLRICKACRGRLLAKSEEWRNECITFIPLPKDHDGELLEEGPGAYIPFRVYGRTRMVTREEFQALKLKTV